MTQFRYGVRAFRRYGPEIFQSISQFAEFPVKRPEFVHGDTIRANRFRIETMFEQTVQRTAVFHHDFRAENIGKMTEAFYPAAEFRFVSVVKQQIRLCRHGVSLNCRIQIPAGSRAVCQRSVHQTPRTHQKLPVRIKDSQRGNGACSFRRTFNIASRSTAPSADGKIAAGSRTCQHGSSLLREHT